MTKSSTYYEQELISGKMEVIGKFKSEGTIYNILGGSANYCGFEGFGTLDSCRGMGYADASSGFLGCATEQISQHFSKYFGMLITEAKYGDMVDFEIVENKYQ